MNNKEIYNGTVMAVHRERYEVYGEEEQIFCRLKTGIYYGDKFTYEFPTVGDRVQFEYNPLGDSLIVKTEERHSMFSRQDPDVGKGEQVVAANFDYVFIMMSLNYDFNIKRLERYLTATWQSGGTPVIILTKADIGEDIDSKLSMVYDVALGVDVHVVSSVTGEGMEAIEQYIEKKSTIVFLGSSGVGKSTFTNYLLGDQVMKTNTIREDDSKGQHTTTYRQMFILKNGAMIIDTPGMRELGLMSVSNGIEKTFSDIHELSMECKFSDCTHQNEPGCAITKALEEGTLTYDRWYSYLKIQKESKYQEAKASLKKSREQKENDKKLAKYIRNNKNKKASW